jgi:SpoVK/Ycf46/Vps4 family AAA+-type ATPase
MDKKIILIEGPNNSLKTSLGIFIAKHFGFKSNVLSNYDLKNNKSIKEYITKISNNRNIMNMIYKKNEDLILIFDDFDLLANNNDKSIIKEFITIFNVDKKTNKDENVLLHPIICIMQDNNDKKLNELRKFALEIKLNTLKYEDYLLFFNNYCLENNLNISSQKQEEILGKIDLDLRKIKFFVQDLLLIAGENPTDEDIEFILKSFTLKNSELKLNESLSKIFSKDISVKESIDLYYQDKFLFPFLIHENYPYNLGKTAKEKSIEYLSEISKNLSKNDVVQNVIFEKQLWDLNINSALLTVKKTNDIYLKNINSSKFKKQDYGTLLNKVSLFYTNRKKVYNTLLQKYGTNTNDIYYFSEFICEIIRRINKKCLNEQIEKYLLPYLKKYDMTSTDIDLLIRINKFNENDVRKCYTNKYKNQMKKYLD